MAVQAGTIMAASTRFHAVVRGHGGHGGMPHLARDPVIAAAAIVHALQPLVSRETDPLDGAVISVTRLSTGRERIPLAVYMLSGVGAEGSCCTLQSVLHAWDFKTLAIWSADPPVISLQLYSTCCPWQAADQVQGGCQYGLCAGEGATNVIPDTVEVGGSLRGLSEQHFYRLIERATEVLFLLLSVLQQLLAGPWSKSPALQACSRVP